MVSGFWAWRTVKKVRRPGIRTGGDVRAQHVQRGVGDGTSSQPGGVVHQSLHEVGLRAHDEHVQGRHLEQPQSQAPALTVCVSKDGCTALTMYMSYYGYTALTMYVYEHGYPH